MNIKVGTLDVLNSGSFLIERGKSFEFDIPEPDKEPLKLILFLTDDKSEKKFLMNPRLIDKTTLEINLVNFDEKGVGGGGLLSPTKIGTFQDRALYFAFFISTVNDKVMPLFNYSFYLGEEEVDSE